MIGGRAECDEELRRDHATSPKAPRTVDDEPSAIAKRFEDSGSISRPAFVERRTGRRHVRNGHVIPEEPGLANLGREFRYAETSEFVVFDHCQYGAGAPCREIPQIIAKVSLPLTPGRVDSVPARAVRNPERAGNRNRYFRNPKGTTQLHIESRSMIRRRIGAGESRVMHSVRHERTVLGDSRVSQTEIQPRCTLRLTHASPVRMVGVNGIGGRHKRAHGVYALRYPAGGDTSSMDAPA